MTTPNIPYTLATSTGGANTPLTVTGWNEARQDVCLDATNGGRNSGKDNWYDPADLIRELSRFVSIPAEARKVISDWLARPVHNIQTREFADDLLATLAAAGLLVGPGEPAREHAPEAVEVLAEAYGDVPSLPGAGCTAHADLAYRGLEALAAAGYVVTAEPATAPSVEQIAEVLGPWADEDAYNIAEEIRALWSPASEDASEARGHLREIYDTLAAAGAPKSGAVEMAKWVAGHVKELESALAASKHNYANMRDGRLNDTQVANEHLRAALKAAEAHATAIEEHWQAVAHRDNAMEQVQQAYDTRNAARTRATTARAAVEADTSEEAGKCTGAGGCDATVHVHGCYADRGLCNDPSDHA